MVIGPILNRSANYSRGRWNLISLGGGVGALMGGGLAVLVDAWQGDARAGFGLTAAGSVAGLFLMASLTKDFDVDESHPGSALLHFEEGKISAGNPVTSITPARFLDRTGAAVNLLDGRF